MSSISTTSLTSDCKHKYEPCFSKPKAKFYVPGCWGNEMRSLQTDITYGVNPENLESMENMSLEKQFFHSSGNCSGTITVTSAGHNLVSGVHK